MNRYEKMAWFTLTLCAIATIAFLVVIPLAGYPVASALFGIVGFGGLAPLVFKEREKPDERDRTILRSAQRNGFGVFWLCFVLANIGTWGWLYYRGVPTVPIEVLPGMVFGGMIVVIAAQSIVTIVLYRRGVGHGEI